MAIWNAERPAVRCIAWLDEFAWLIVPALTFTELSHDGPNDEKCPDEDQEQTTAECDMWIDCRPSV